MPNNKDSGREKMIIMVEEIVSTLRTGVKLEMSSPGHAVQEIHESSDRIPRFVLAENEPT